MAPKKKEDFQHHKVQKILEYLMDDCVPNVPRSLFGGEVSREVPM